MASSDRKRLTIAYVVGGVVVLAVAAVVIVLASGGGGGGGGGGEPVHAFVFTGPTPAEPAE